jgi:tellurite resistance protein TerC
VEEAHIRTLPEKHRRRIRQEAELMELIRRAHRLHEERIADGVCFVASVH